MISLYIVCLFVQYNYYRAFSHACINFTYKTYIVFTFINFSIKSANTFIVSHSIATAHSSLPFCLALFTPSTTCLVSHVLKRTRPPLPLATSVAIIFIMLTYANAAHIVVLEYSLHKSCKDAHMHGRVCGTEVLLYNTELCHIYLKCLHINKNLKKGFI